MGVRILAGTYDGTKDAACLVDSTNDRAFGPLFDGYDDAQEFLDWLGRGSARIGFEDGDAPPFELRGGVSNFTDARGYDDPDDLARVAAYWRVERDAGRVAS